MRVGVGMGLWTASIGFMIRWSQGCSHVPEIRLCETMLTSEPWRTQWHSFVSYTYSRWTVWNTGHFFHFCLTWKHWVEILVTEAGSLTGLVLLTKNQPTYHGIDWKGATRRSHARKKVPINQFDVIRLGQPVRFHAPQYTQNVRLLLADVNESDVWIRIMLVTDGRRKCPFIDSLIRLIPISTQFVPFKGIA